MQNVLKQLGDIIGKTFDFKGITKLKECAIALSFQLVISSVVTLLFLGTRLTDLGMVVEILIYVLYGYLGLTLVSFLSVLARRFRDAGIHPVYIFLIPFSYVLFFIVSLTFNFKDGEPLMMMLPLFLFFLPHLYVLFMVLLPSKQIQMKVGDLDDEQ
ncbi:MAG: hypothetical protein A2Y45_06170 [Tenericutes bacterium GWC2_34_14]|nr:MAG: hypothetical protein A2Y45_06170 [Tenericutes bacterium GWC2_34_14]OHE33551.1 MAG: hypothetical protein A2012_03640 [Tenericutes bacterium GWE2_34_108]OHE36836.1 MAG: hypothetical protein A2Y46_09440 [Tenericutes bacterium GWF1_35_14]OHE38084.1 MAG: hypothetical protein A2Y44_09225 [Tenericutes bacterium GWF2_35_184]OHE42107.1 MAG: hypothetical protein A3K26_08050 [Tenericutes bacterium RIFOXYA12_FULL_35_10]OHE43399.1 MAG: hypothetical protein A2221_06510 [Tenericutes bacterium RIFOXYA